MSRTTDILLAGEPKKKTAPPSYHRYWEGAPDAAGWTSNPTAGTPEMLKPQQATKQTETPQFLSPKPNITVPQQQPQGSNASDGITMQMLTRKDTREKQDGNASLGIRQDLKDDLTKPSSASPTATMVKAETEKAAAEPPKNVSELYQQLAKKRDEYDKERETPEDKKKRERRERAQRTIASIADAASAVANLYYTSQYAPNMYTQEHALEPKLQKRFDKAKADRDAIEQNYYNYAMKLQQMDDKERDRQAKAKIADAQAKREEKKLKIAEDAAKAKAKAADDEAKRKAAKDKADGERADKEAASREKYRQGQLALGRQRNAIYASKGNGGSRSSSSSKKSGAYTPEHTRAAWDEWWKYTDAERDEWRKKFANRYGEDANNASKYKDDDNFVNAVKQMHDSYLSNPNNPSRTRPKTMKSDNTPPSRRKATSNNDNVPPSRRKK